MSTTMAQWLFASDVFGNPTELINGARTAHRLRWAASCGQGDFSDVLDNAGCDALLLDPCAMAADGSTTEWPMIDLLPQASPWYTGTDASLEAYGFFIEEWTGMDGAHHGRSVTPLGRGGANYGPQSHGPRVMKLNVLLVGETERGLTHLFRWLEDRLLGCCKGCVDSSIWVREFCPVDWITNPEEGMGRLARVVLLEGPTWEAPVTDRSGCSVRRASFTLGAGGPCMYGSPVECLADTTDTVVTHTGFTSIGDVAPDLLSVSIGAGWFCTPSFASVNYGALAPVVTIASAYAEVSSQRKTLPDLRISAYTNPGALTPAPYTLRKIGELVISGRGMAGLVIEADLAERRVRYHEATGPSPAQWVDGSRLIARPVETNLPRWFSVRECDYPVIAVEPVYGDLNNSVESTTSTVTSLTVGIDMVHRWSCC